MSRQNLENLLPGVTKHSLRHTLGSEVSPLILLNLEHFNTETEEGWAAYLLHSLWVPFIEKVLWKGGAEPKNVAIAYILACIAPMIDNPDPREAYTPSVLRAIVDAVGKLLEKDCRARALGTKEVDPRYFLFEVLAAICNVRNHTTADYAFLMYLRHSKDEYGSDAEPLKLVTGQFFSVPRLQSFEMLFLQYADELLQKEGHDAFHHANGKMDIARTLANALSRNHVVNSRAIAGAGALLVGLGENTSHSQVALLLDWAQILRECSGYTGYVIKHLQGYGIMVENAPPKLAWVAAGVATKEYQAVKATLTLTSIDYDVAAKSFTKEELLGDDDWNMALVHAERLIREQVASPRMARLPSHLSAIQVDGPDKRSVRIDLDSYRHLSEQAGISTRGFGIVT